MILIFFLFSIYSHLLWKNLKKMQCLKAFFKNFFFLSSYKANLLNHLWHFFKFQNFTLQEKNIAKNSKEKTTKTTNAKVINAKTHATSKKSIYVGCLVALSKKKKFCLHRFQWKGLISWTQLLIASLIYYIFLKDYIASDTKKWKHWLSQLSKKRPLLQTQKELGV